MANTTSTPCPCDSGRDALSGAECSDCGGLGVVAAAECPCGRLDFESPCRVCECAPVIGRLVETLDGTWTIAGELDGQSVAAMCGDRHGFVRLSAEIEAAKAAKEAA